MKNPVTWFTCLFIAFLPLALSAQKTLPKDYFKAPLEIKPFITGTFGESRTDHMHSGLDYATNGRIGIPVYAVADGYVSRVKVSATGYGRVIYLTHPNGYVSVYAHLNEFNVVVEDYIRRKQYEKQSFEIELLPDPALFKFKKGELIGYSGNTGASTGPHLHFEIRSEKTERPLNPALFGIYAPDELSPMVRRLKVYPEGNNSVVNGQHAAAIYSFVQEKNQFQYRLTDTVKVTGSCTFGMLVGDYVSAASNEAGIYSWQLLVDDVPLYSAALDSFAFDDTRMVNDLIDYKEWSNTGIRYTMFRRSSGDLLPIFEKPENKGVLTFNTEKLVKITMIATDIVGHKAELNFMVLGQPALKAFSNDLLTDSAKMFYWDKPAHYQTSDFKVDLPAYSIFENTDFYYARMNSPVPALSAMHRIGRAGTPLIKPLTLSIKLENIPEKYREKLVIARMQGPRDLAYSGGDVKEDYIETRAYRFGDYVVTADTTAPVVKPLGFSSHKNISAMQVLRLAATDDLSGVKLYRAEVNGKWTLMEYDAKNDLLLIPVDELFVMGKNTLKVVVVDARNNVTKLEYILIR